jgi:outer membrane protein assembly factor BamB
LDVCVVPETFSLCFLRRYFAWFPCAKDGTPLWKVDITGRNTFQLVVFDDIVYSMHSSSCFAYRGSDGSLLWQQHIGQLCSSPTIVDGKMYVGVGEHRFISLEFSSEDDMMNPKFPNPKLIAKTFLYALSIHDGLPLWQQRIGNVDDISHLTRPTVAHDIVYVGTNNGTIYALDTQDGAFRWDYKTGGSNVSQPIVVDDVLYVGSNDGCVYALHAKDGAFLWKTFVSTAVSMRLVGSVEHNN